MTSILGPAGRRAAITPPSFRGVAAPLATWHRRLAGRRRLLEMDARQLKDIGLNPGAAAEEAAKPCWRA